MSLLTKRVADSEPEEAPQEKKVKTMVTIKDGEVAFGALSIYLIDMRGRLPDPQLEWDLFDPELWNKWAANKRIDFPKWFSWLVYLQKHATHFTTHAGMYSRMSLYPRETEEDCKKRLDARVERVTRVELHATDEYRFPCVYITTDKGLCYSNSSELRPNMCRQAFLADPDDECTDYRTLDFEEHDNAAEVAKAVGDLLAGKALSVRGN